MSTTIEKELEAFRKKLPSLLAQEGKFALIQEGEIPEPLTPTRMRLPKGISVSSSNRFW